MGGKDSKVQISQIDKFREAAREAEADEREEAFDKIVKRIAKAAPEPKPPMEQTFRKGR